MPYAMRFSKNKIVVCSNHCLQGRRSMVGTGEYNCIDTQSAYSFIGAGVHNCIMNPASTQSSCYSFIGAGRYNTISNCYSSIVGGGHNTASGQYSAILGGCGNSDNGLNYAGVFGCGVTAVSACAFHANNFVAQNMPNTPGLAGSGCLYYQYYAPLLGCVVMIS